MSVSKDRMFIFDPTEWAEMTFPEERDNQTEVVIGVREENLGIFLDYIGGLDDNFGAVYLYRKKMLYRVTGISATYFNDALGYQLYLVGFSTEKPIKCEYNLLSKSKTHIEFPIQEPPCARVVKCQFIDYKVYRIDSFYDYGDWEYVENIGNLNEMGIMRDDINPDKLQPFTKAMIKGGKKHGKQRIEKC